VLNKAFLWPLGAITCLLLGGYLLLPSYLPAIVSHFLLPEDFFLESLDIDHPRFSRVAINELKVGRLGVGVFHFTRGEVQWGRAGGRRLIELRFEHGDYVHADTSAKPSSEEPTPIDLTSLLPSLTFTGAPKVTVAFDSLNVDAFDLHFSQVYGEYTGEDALLSFDLEPMAGYLHEKISASIGISDGNEVRVASRVYQSTVDMLVANGVIKQAQGDIALSLSGSLALDSLVDVAPFELPFTQTSLEFSSDYTVPGGVFDMRQANALSATISVDGQARDTEGREILSATRLSAGLGANAYNVTVNTFEAKLIHDKRDLALLMTAPWSMSGNLSSGVGRPTTLGTAALALHVDSQPAAKVSLSDLGIESSTATYQGTAELSIENSLLNSLFGTDEVALQGETLTLTSELILDDEALTVNIPVPVSVPLKSTAFKAEDYLVNIILPKQSITADYALTSVSELTATVGARSDAGTDVQGSLRISMNQRRIEMSIASERMQVERYVVPSMSVIANIYDWGQGGMTLDAELFNACQDVLARGTAHVVGQEYSGHLSIHQVFDERASLSAWLNMPDVPLDIFDGELSGRLDFRRQKSEGLALPTPLETRFIVALKANKGMSQLGTIEDIQFSFSSAPVVLDSSIQHVRHIAFSSGNDPYYYSAKMQRFDVGIPITKLSFNGHLLESDGTWRTTGEFSADVFSGNVTAIANNTELMAPETIIDVNNVDLSQVVETQQVEGLEATGLLSGRIPLIFEDDTLILKEGVLTNPQGGLIKYQSAISGGENINEQLKLTLDVLENFNYQILDTGLSYHDGELTLKSKISGSNPSVAGGQRVDLNLNTDLDLKSVFKLIRIQSGLEDEVKRYLSNTTNDDLNFCLTGS